MIAMKRRRRPSPALSEHAEDVRRRLGRTLVWARMAEASCHRWADDVFDRVDLALAPDVDRMQDPEYEAANQLLTNIVQLHDLVAGQLQAWSARVGPDGAPRPWPIGGGDAR